MSVCRHCQRVGLFDRRNLCRRCYRDRAVRALYPPLPGCRQRRAGKNSTLPAAPSPTPYPPGSVEKLLVMQARVLLGYHPHHPGDGRSWAGVRATPLLAPARKVSRPWTAAEDAAAADMLGDGFGVGAVAAALGRSPDAVTHRLNRRAA